MYLRQATRSKAYVSPEKILWFEQEEAELSFPIGIKICRKEISNKENPTNTQSELKIHKGNRTMKI